MKSSLWILLVLLFAMTARACIWDAETLLQEKWRNYDLAKAILGEPPAPENSQTLQERIKNLEANRDENNPDWWNNLAGAYMRLNQPATAVKLLEPVVPKFPNDYGIHANLGTAYHLLGRYKEAEKEIGRDLEINPAAHFGLEKYHLALLQYLIRDSKYKSRHVYVDEFTATFLTTSSSHFFFSDSAEEISREMAQSYTNLAEAEAEYGSPSNRTEGSLDKGRMEMLATVAALDVVPSYRAKWNLATDTYFEAGVIYMAQMNPKEPACFEMLGIAAWKKHNYHLAISAFEKAIALGSLKSGILQDKIAALRHYISKSFNQKFGTEGFVSLVLFLIPLVILYYIYTKIRDWRRKPVAQK